MLVNTIQFRSICGCVVRNSQKNWITEIKFLNYISTLDCFFTQVELAVRTGKDIKREYISNMCPARPRLIESLLRNKSVLLEQMPLLYAKFPLF